MIGSPPSEGSDPVTENPPASAVVWLGWHLLALLSIILGAQLRMDDPLWDLSPARSFSVLSLLAAHVVASVVIWSRRTRHAPLSPLQAAATLVSVYGLLALGHILLGLYVSRSLLSLAVFFSLMFGIVAEARGGSGRRIIPVGAAALLLIVVAALGAGVAEAGRDQPPTTDPSVVETTFYDLRLSITDSEVLTNVGGGSLQPLNRGFLVALGDGSMYYLEEITRPDSLRMRRLPYGIPINRDVFLTEVPEAQQDRFRIGDILTVPSGERTTLVAAHHYWRSEARCFVLRLSIAEVRETAFLEGTEEPRWRTLFDAEPCLPMRGPDEATPGEGAFSGHMLGGRLVAFDDHRVLLAVGDHAFDGVNAKRIVAQDRGSHYGKTVLVDLTTGAAEIYTMGHRNQLGLHLAPDGRIWSTEQGPEGGDELNLIERGSNYGWPLETFGVEYDLEIWPLAREQGRHTEYTAPVLSWVPSIAVSNLITIQSDLFPVWRGDLLAASLFGDLYRIRHQDGRVIFDEFMHVGRRVRDLAEASDGRIVMLFDGGGIGVFEPVDPSGAGTLPS